MKPVREIPLIAFTLLGQAAVGLSIMNSAGQLLFPKDPLFSGPVLPVTSFLILMAAFVSSVFHLGHPKGGIRSFANLKFSWLSREILFFGSYALLLIVEICTEIAGAESPWTSLCVITLGCAAVYVSARVYKNYGFAALNDFSCSAFFFLSSLILGAAISKCFSPEAAAGVFFDRLLWAFLSVSLVLSIFQVFSGLRKGHVIRETARRMLGSPLWWTRQCVLLGLVLGCGLFFQLSPVLMVFGVLVEETIGKILFFNLPVHTSQFIGRPFSKGF